MINKIKSLDGKFEMTLAHPLAKEIYNIDSINLLIGDNGSGKTKTIKAIIDELTLHKPGENFIIEGAPEHLGVVYYTAAPFHKKIRVSKKTSTEFIDASPPRSFAKGITGAAEEYIRVAEELQITSSLHSECKFPIRDVAFSVVRRLTTTNLLPPDILTLYKEYKGVNDRYNRQLTERRRLREKLEHLSELADNTTTTLSADDTDKIKISEIEGTIEQLALARFELKERITDEFLKASPPNNRKWSTAWIAACKLSVGVQQNLYRHQIARYLCTRNDAHIPNFPGWQSLFKKITSFIRLVEKNDSGELFFSKDEIALSIDIPKLLSSKISENIFEDAYKLELVKIGFDSVSSGEAAILNQLINIGNAVRELHDSGKTHIILFIDEGDILLHLAWQRRYLSLINTRLGDLKKSLKLKALQVVIATHSPLLASDVFRESITRMSPNGLLPAFGAPIQSIINCSFGTPSIGEIAENEILRLRNAGHYSEKDLAMIDEIDDDFIRNFLHKNKK